MKLTFPHIIAYAVAGLTAIATLQPNIAAALQSVLGPAGHLVPAGVALAGALLAFIHDVAPTAVPASAVTVSPTVNKSAGFISLRGAILLATVAVSVAFCLNLCACSTVSSWLSSPTGIEVDVAAVDVAIAAAEAKGVTAVEINKVAKAALAADAGTPATIGAISTAVNGAISKANLPAADLAAINLIELALSQAITAKIGANPTVAALQTDVASVLSLVITATGG